MEGKAEPVVAVFLGEPMLDCIIGLTRRGVPFCENNRSEDTMVPSWRDPDLFQMEAIAPILWDEGQSRVHFIATKTFLLHTLIIKSNIW